MSYQPQISMISGTAPPSYMEAIGQTPPPPKDGFPVPPTMPQPYGSYVQPPPMGGQYSTINANYREYNAAQPSFNPIFVPPPPAPDATQPVQRPCVVTTTIVRRKRYNGTCLSCVRMITLVILILIAVSYLLKVIIASTSY